MKNKNPKNSKEPVVVKKKFIKKPSTVSSMQDTTKPAPKVEVKKVRSLTNNASP